MPEEVGTFLSAKLRHERANCSVETRDDSLGSLAQPRFEFAVRQLDGIEVGRVLWQVASCRVCLPNRLLYARDFMGSEVIHHNDVVATQRWNQALFDVGAEYLSGHGAPVMAPWMIIGATILL
jgi:hypothetical protein